MNPNYLHEDNVKNKMNYWHLFVRMMPFFTRFKFQLILVVFVVFAVALVSRLQPTLIGYAIDEGILKKDILLVKKVALLYFTFELTLGLLIFSQLYLFQKLGNRILYHLRETLISHIQALPLGFFDKTPAGRIVTRITNDVGTLGELFSAGLISVFINIVSIMAILIAMSLISVKLTIISLITAPIFGYVFYQLTRKIQVVLRDSKKSLARINAYVAENINGMKVVQLYNRVHKNVFTFNKHSQEYRDIQLKSIFQYALFWPLVNFFSAVMVTFSLYWGGILKYEGALQIGSLIAFFMHVQDIIPPLRNFLERYQMFQNSLTSGERIFNLLDETAENLDGIEIKKAKGQLEFKNLSFQYEPHLPFVLQNVSFNIHPGESVAIVGRTGSGKTTIISLLQRFYQYSQGSIRVDEYELNSLSRRSIRRSIGVVQQDNFIFRGTIRENINLQDSSIDTNKVIESARKVGLARLIERNGKGIDQLVEERGSNLSSGERQLIAFARILAFNPDILILDEATSNIDSESELLIQQATREVTKHRTSLIIAHRLSTIRECNKIVVLDKGHIVECGTHEELYAKQGYYFDLYSKQKSLD